MKKIICLLILSVCMLSFSVCENKENTNHSSEMSKTANTSKVTWTVDSVRHNAIFDLSLSEEDAVVLEDLLSSDNWVNAVTNCAVDVTLKGDDGCLLTYHSECGTFNDLTKIKSLRLDESEKDSFNELLSKYVELGL